MSELDDAIADHAAAWAAWAALPTRVHGMTEAVRAVATWDWLQAAERRLERLRADNEYSVKLDQDSE